MADFLSTSVSGLLAFQRALDTTSHNIANANTPGYSRQVVDLGTRQAQASGAGWVGNGVDVSSVRRSYDDFLAGQSRSTSSSYRQFDTYATQAGRLNNLFGSTTAGLTASLQGFMNAVQSVADTPTSIPARQALLSQANTLADRLQSYDASLRSFDAQVNAQLEHEASSINSLAQNIARLNQEIANGYARTRQPPNDLLDQRDRMIDELAKHVSVDVVREGDGSVNVFVGKGQSLVVGQNAASLVTSSDPYDPTRKVISVKTANGLVDVSSSLSGGTLGGMLDFRTRMLDPARNTLGRLSVALADVVNAQQNAGMDLNGNLGGDLFGVGGVRVQSHAANAGTGAATVTRVADATGALTASDYLLVANGGGWTLQRTDTGATVPMTGSGTAGDPFIADGLSIVVSGTPANGDRLLIKPTSEAVAGLDVLITRPDEIAAAAPILGVAGTANRGTGTITPGQVIDASNPLLRSTVTISFTSPTQYQLSGDPTVYTYTPGADIDVNGWRVQVGGAPAAGDTFTVRDNTSGVGDNRNALRLADVLNQPVLNGGSTSLNAAVGQFVGSIGVETNQAQVTRDAQKVVFEESAGALESVAGVNLDEEAANLVRYQQAYMAAAQMIRVADTIFQSVLNATRG